MNVISRKTTFTLLIITLVSILGGYFIYRATSWGPWAFSDSSAYLSAARNIQAGNGAAILNSNGSITSVTEFPPLFPFILSLFTPKEGNFVSTARWINIIFFFLSIFIVGLLSYKAFHNFFTALFSSTLIAVSPLMVDTFSGFMSEPIFIGLLLSLVFLFLEFINSKKGLLLIPIFILSSFLPLIRYAGVLFVLCFSICFYVFRKKYSQKAIRIIPLYIVFSLAPIGLWFINQINNFNKIGGKRFSLNIDFIKNVFQTILQEFRIIQGWIPYSGIYSNKNINLSILVLFSSLIIISMALGISAIIKKKTFQNQNSLFLFQICLIFFSAYILFIGFTHNLTIPSIDIIDRMMAPIFPFILLILFWGFEILWINKRKRLVRSTLLIITLVSIRFYLLSTISSVEELHNNGKGFTSRQYQESEFLEKLVSLPADQPMVSNSAAFVLFHTNRYPLPVEQFHNRQFGSGDAYGEKSFRERNAALIIVLPEFHNYYGEDSDQLLKSLTAGLREDFLDKIGGIFYYPEQTIQQ